MEVFTIVNFTQPIAVITGVSHSEGIGASVCRKLAAEGYSIFFTHWQSSPEWLTTFQQEIESYKVPCSHLEIDLSQANAASMLLDAVSVTSGTPSVLVNNAAHSRNDGYLKLNAKTLDDHYSVNMRTTFLLCTEFARLFKKENMASGRIINLTSGQAQGPMPNELAYVATKGAITAFTLSLSAEIAPLGITVNAVNPGPTDTGWMTDELKEELKPKFKMGRIGHPDDAARIIAFLASQDAEWITGQVINSEGGFLRQ